MAFLATRGFPFVTVGAGALLRVGLVGSKLRGGDSGELIRLKDRWTVKEFRISWSWAC